MFSGFQSILRKNRFAFMAILFLLLDVGYYFLISSYSIDARFALYETISTYFFLLFFSFILQRIHTYYHSRSAISVVHLSIIFIFSFMINLLINEYGQWLASGQHDYLNYLSGAFYLRWFILFLILLTVVNQLWIVKHLQEQEQTIRRLIEKERDLTRAEISGIQQQLRPHFLFNSLNSVSALVKSQPDKAREMIHELSDFLRISLSKANADRTTLSEELEYLNLYLSIEKVRFGHRLSIDMNIQEGIDEAILPALILQPIVENAIKYGIYGNTGELTISVQAQMDNGKLILSVENPYDPENVASSRGTGFGLSSVRRKLELIYRRPDLMNIEQHANRFKITIMLPQ